MSVRKRLAAFVAVVVAVLMTFGGGNHLRMRLTAAEAEPAEPHADTRSGTTVTDAEAATEAVQVQAFLNGLVEQQRVDAYLQAIHAKNLEIARFLQGLVDAQRAEAEAQEAERREAAAARGDWRSLVAQYPWNQAVAQRIVMCESGGDPNAYNPKYGATGLFQILRGPRDPAANVARAYEMYQQRGWQPWNASRDCWS